MKARYFPRTNFLEAEVGQNPSSVWRSITTAFEVIRVGARRKRLALIFIQMCGICRG